MKRIAITLLLLASATLIIARVIIPNRSFEIKALLTTDQPEIGDAVDSLHGVMVFYNGSVSHTTGRNLSHDGYNLGLKYQCVEFAKRYYYEHLNHKMPDSYGHAKDFFNPNLADGTYNKSRNLMQFTNGSKTPPQADDLVIWKGSQWNPYGHIAVIASVLSNQEVEIIQQNPGPYAPSRIRLALYFDEEKWTIADPQIMGWIGKRN